MTTRLNDYLGQLAAYPAPETLLLPRLPMAEPDQAQRLLISGSRGCGKTTLMLSHARLLAYQALSCLPLSGGTCHSPIEVLSSLAEIPLYLDMRAWSGSLLDLAAAALASPSGERTNGHELAETVLAAPAMLLLDHVESLPAGCLEGLGEELARWPERTGIWAAWRAVPGGSLPAWLADWPQLSLGDWDDTQVLHALSASLEAPVAAEAARHLVQDRQVWRAAHRPWYFKLIVEAVQAPFLNGAALPNGESFPNGAWPARAELAMEVLGRLLDLENHEALQEWLDRPGFGVCRLGWKMLEQDVDVLSVEEADRVMQESGGVTLNALILAGVLNCTNGAPFLNGAVTFDQPLVSRLCAAWYARARPDRFGGGEQAAIGCAGRARALHHALDVSDDRVALLDAALDIAAPNEMFRAAAGWLVAVPPEQARETLSALARRATPDVMILLAHTLRVLAEDHAPLGNGSTSPRSDARDGLAVYAAELARTGLRATRRTNGAIPGPAAPQTWPALHRASSNTLRAVVEEAAGRPEAALHSARSALLASTAAAAWSAHELGQALLQKKDLAAALQVFELAVQLQPEEPAHRRCAGLALLEQRDTARAVEHLRQAYKLAPQDATTCLALAEACARTEAGDEARRCAEQAAALLSLSARSMYRTLEAQAYYRLAQVWLALQPLQAEIEAKRLELDESKSVSPLNGVLGQAGKQLGEIRAPILPAHHAIEALQCGVQRAPAQVAWQVELARLHLQLGQVPQAIDACRRALVFCPDDTQAHRWLGQALLSAAALVPNSLEADRHLAVALREQPDDVELLLLQAESLAQRGQVEAALSSFERVLTLRPGDLHAAANLARLYAEHGQPADAQVVLDWTLARCPAHPPSLAVRGLLSEQQGELAQAVDYYAQALELADDSSLPPVFTQELHERRARLYRQMGQLNEARAEIEERWVPACGESQEAWHELARVHLARGRPQAALECLKRLVALDSNPRTSTRSTHPLHGFEAWPNPETLCLWGQVYLDKAEPRTALRIFAQAIRLARVPSDLDGPSLLAWQAEAFEGLGHALDQLGERSQAVPAYKQAISLAPDHPAAYYALGRLYRQMGCMEESVAVLTDAARVLPGDVTCCVELGQSFAHLGWWREAEEQFARAVSLAPGTATYLRWQGRALRQLKHFEAAKTALEHACELGGDVAATWVELAWLHRDAGDMPAALAALEQAAQYAADTTTLVEICRTLREFGKAEQAEDLLVAAERDGLQGELIPPRQVAMLQAELGQARLARGRLDAALSAFEQAVERDPQRGEYQAALAHALAGTGQLDKAVQHWFQARALGYETIELLQTQGQALESLARYAEALDTYERWIELRPRDAQAYLAAAQAARRLGRVERAVELAGWATSLEPGLTAAYVLVGEVCMENGRSDQALTALKRASSLSPGDRPVWLGLAKAALDSGQAETALQAAQALLLRDQTDADAFLVLGTAHLTLGQWQPAAQAFGNALARRPEDPDAAWGLGRAVAALGIRAEIARREGCPPAGSGLSGEELNAAVTALRSSALRSQVSSCAARGVLEALLMSLRGEKNQAAQCLKASLPGPGLEAEALTWMSLVWRWAGLPQMGLGVARSAARLAPRDPLLLYELGAVLEELALAPASSSPAGLGRARSAYRRAAELEPDNGLYWHALARVCVRLDQIGLARQAFESALTACPQSPTWLAELGLACAEQDDLEPAALAFEQACHLVAEGAERKCYSEAVQAGWHRQLGLIYARLGRHAAAVSELESAIRQAPGQAEWWVELGMLHDDAGAGARALLCYKQAITHAPDDVNLILSTAQLAGELNRWNDALDIVTAALARQPRCASLHARLAILHEQAGRLEQAMEACRQATRLAPDVPVHYLEAGRLALQLDRPEEAAHYLERALSVGGRGGAQMAYPDAASPASQARAHCKATSRQADRACREAYGLLGDAYLALGRQDEALQVYQHASTLEPGNVAHRLRLGRVYRQRNALDQALAHLEVALSLAPDSTAALEEMAAAYEEQGEYRHALQVCLDLIERLSGSGANRQAEADACFRAGMLYKQLKAFPEALAMFKRAARLLPDHAEAGRQGDVVKAMGFFAIGHSDGPV
ncbi:MAG: tetratricopeptide repeat protein [Thermoflexales bacterium]|nr:tetratricopeptide repeat protein [Thermoflexales bacterium]